MRSGTSIRGGCGGLCTPQLSKKTAPATCATKKEGTIEMGNGSAAASQGSEIPL